MDISLEDDANNWGAKYIFLHAKEIETLTRKCWILRVKFPSNTLEIKQL